ncbi:MAG: DEAD/DEAH box helicase family protein [Planctomycetaceae bacterium]|jgi:type III restriction enzyme|nr:DEAD/DEAH box helicase family protein [Planctomycetaceae bacterium]
MKFLYDLLIQEFGRRTLEDTDVPDFISGNLKHTLRPYQIEALQRFILCHTENFRDKPALPLHLLFNMATGSGKTLIMAGLILYLYEKGYRNFLFFVNLDNITQKTRENFLNPLATKYLFKEKIIVAGEECFIREVENFEESDDKNINIKFTTIQKLHSDLTTAKENSITYEDFENKKIVLIGDEAHHLNAGTRGKSLLGSWEDTVEKINKSDFENILLEFTATLDYESPELRGKYEDKILYKYDLAQFRLDKYSKEINLFRSQYDEQDRIIQALILNLYRQILAAEHNINLKPVILFKAKRTIAESEENKNKFHELIDNISEKNIGHIRQTSAVPVIHKAFHFFDTKKMTLSDIAEKIRFYFIAENCISANNDAESEKNQILLNTLEDANNPIRAIFAVQKLNEGWDVLNLFDIVRLYEGRDSRNGKPGNVTISEAQLIGRGARYFPFQLNESQDKYTRKFDNDTANDLRILEELYYHTKEDNHYISELKTALIETGIYEDDKNLETKQLLLKLDFKESNFYKMGYVVFNKKIEKDFHNIRSFADLGVKKQNYRYKLSSGRGRVTHAFDFLESSVSSQEITRDVKLSNIPHHVLRFALTQNPFFYFENLTHYFPNIRSISEFIKDKNYLDGLEITLEGTQEKLDAMTPPDYLGAITSLLQSIETEIKSVSTEYEGSDYTYDYLSEVFKDKEIRVEKNSERAKGQEELVADKEWYVYNANYGTNEEKKFVELFSRRFEQLRKKFSMIYLIRNERELKIYDKQGRAFEPDFLLFCKSTNGKNLTWQVFIEPKGKHLIAHDKWKEDFLKNIRKEQKTIKINTDEYIITGVPFYRYENENDFAEELEDVLNNSHDKFQ